EDLLPSRDRRSPVLIPHRPLPADSGRGFLFSSPLGGVSGREHETFPPTSRADDLDHLAALDLHLSPRRSRPEELHAEEGSCDVAAALHGRFVPSRAKRLEGFPEEPVVVA